MTSMEQPWYWAALELDADSDERAVKRAYARQLKTTRPDDDPDAFQRLRAAYEYALGELRHRAAAPVEAPPAPVAEPAQLSAPVTLDKIEVAAPAPVIVPVQRHAIGEAPDALAQAVWEDFLATCELGPLASLAAAQADERLQGFDARDAFELLAARHAASDACSADLRDALVDHFDWTGRAATVLRSHPAIAAAVLNRHAADQGWNHLVHQARTDPVLAFLVRDDVPAKLPRRWDANFVRSMRATLQNIRWRHAELLEHRINHDVFSWWETQVADKRYFRQTAGWSVVAGFGLWVAIMTATPLPRTTMLQLPEMLLAVCVLLAIAGGAWLAVRPPVQFYTRALELQARWFGKPLLDTRYDRAWQTGWMPPFVLLSMALLLPNLHPLFHALVVVGITACTAMAVLASSLAITRTRFCVAVGMAIASTIIASAVPQFATVPAWSLMCFGLTLFIVFLSHGAPLYRSFGWTNARLKQMRMGWLAAGAACAVLVTGDIAPMLHLPALMLLLLTGVLIARYDAGLRLIWFGLMGVRAINGAVAHNDGTALYPLCLLNILAAYFVVAHLLEDASD